MDDRLTERGLTLVELLVAMVITSTILGVVALLFVSSSSAVKKGYQSMKGFELARGALHVLESDLTSSFTSREHGDVFNLFGTPIGMTFIGVASNRRGMGPDNNPNVSRITYVVYPGNATRFRSLADREFITFRLLRFVEPDVEDLDSFPVDWPDINAPISNEAPVYEKNVYYELMAAVVDTYSGTDLRDVFKPQVIEEVLSAKKRELWIRMLAGDPTLTGDLLEPDFFWNLMNENPLDYVVADGLMANAFSLTGSEDEVQFFRAFERIIRENEKLDPDDFDPDDVVPYLPSIDQWKNILFPSMSKQQLKKLLPEAAFFNYGEYGGWRTNPHEIRWRHFWNSELNVRFIREFWGEASSPEELVTPAFGGTGSPLRPRLPVMVRARFRFKLEGKFVGSAGFDHQFEQTIDIPTGYTRPRARIG